MSLQKTIKFLQDLKQNNSKLWFDEHREEYQSLRKEFLDFVFDLIQKTQEFDDNLGMLFPNKCVYRINRDIRFSKNKLPYKTYFSAAIGPDGSKSKLPGHYFDFGAKRELVVASGVFAPDPNKLLDIRNFISQNPKETQKLRLIMESKEFQKYFSRLAGPKLKTAPKGFAKDHPDIDILNHKWFMVVSSLPVLERLEYPELLKILTERFKTAMPFVKWFRQI